MRTAAAISIAVHAILLLVWPDARAKEREELAVAEAVPIELIEVAVQPGRGFGVPAAPADAPAPADVPAPAPVPVPVPVPVPDTPGTSALSMRGPSSSTTETGAPALSLRAAATSAAATIAAQPPTTPTPTPTPTSTTTTTTTPPPADHRARMDPAGDGTYIHDRPGFTGHVARDGKVTFADKPSFSAGVHMPSTRRIAKKVEAWSADPQTGPTVGIADILPLPTVKFDFTDWLMRRKGMDPYSYEKHEFMERTRERREQMSAVARAEVMRDALADLPEVLAAIWAYTDWPAARRRQALFLLWDECDDTAAGRTARATIVAFIRKRRIRYPDDELAALNRQRSSTAPFAPHDAL